MNYKKPQRLKRGDTVAVLPPSWGGPHAFPVVYEKGLEFLQESGLLIKEFPSTRLSADELYLNPKLRADDINAAFADKAIKDVITIEFGAEDLPIVTNMDFGHTDPQFVLPLGVLAEMDITKKTFKLIEQYFSD